jgi:hypothetical protein
VPAAAAVGVRLSPPPVAWVPTTPIESLMQAVRVI